MKPITNEIQNQVNTLTAEGKTNKEIAETLNISERSVRNYRTEPKIELKPYMHPNNKIDFNLVGNHITFPQGSPGKQYFWMIRAYSTHPVADAVFLVDNDQFNITGVDKCKKFEVLKLNVKDLGDDTNS